LIFDSSLIHFSVILDNSDLSCTIAFSIGSIFFVSLFSIFGAELKFSLVTISFDQLIILFSFSIFISFFATILLCLGLLIDSFSITFISQKTIIHNINKGIHITNHNFNKILDQDFHSTFCHVFILFCLFVIMIKY
jgi:hypothetical protein